MLRHFGGLAEVVDDVDAAVAFYRDVLGLEVEHTPGDDHAQVQLPGVLYYGIWSRRAAAASCFGDPSQAERIPLGFLVTWEVDRVDEASERLAAAGATRLMPPRDEPWGQRVARFLTPGGAFVEVSEAPWMRQLTQNVAASAENA